MGARDGLGFVGKSGHRAWKDVRRGQGRFALTRLSLALAIALPVSGQNAPVAQAPVQTSPPPTEKSATLAPKAQLPGLRAWEGLKVAAVQFRGVEVVDLDPLPARLELQPGTPLDGEKLRDTLRRLYATGLYRTISVEGTRSGNEITIIFTGEPRVFIGRVYVDGVKSDRLAAQLIRAAKLDAGTVYSDTKLDRGQELIKQFLIQDGYYLPAVSNTTKSDPSYAQIDVTYHVTLGQVARVGQVKVDGDSGMSLEEFRKKAKLKPDSKVTRDTDNRALNGLRKIYQKQQRLESDVSLKSRDYQPPTNHLNYGFGVNRGPVVTIEVVGAKLNKGILKKLIPVYEEGAVDDDLLNEGDRSLRDYYQRAGYFNVVITHKRRIETAERADIEYTVDLGRKHRVLNVSVSGNKYFSNDTIEERLGVLKADFFQSSGLYSQALVNSDVTSITALYQSNGFSEVKVTPVVTDSERNASGEPEKIGEITVQYLIDEARSGGSGDLRLTAPSRCSCRRLRR